MEHAVRTAIGVLASCEGSCIAKLPLTYTLPQQSAAQCSKHPEAEGEVGSFIGAYIGSHSLRSAARERAAVGRGGTAERRFEEGLVSDGARVVVAMTVAITTAAC